MVLRQALASARHAAVGVGAVLVGLLAQGSAQREAVPPSEAVRRNNLGVGLMDAGTKDPKYIREAVGEFEAAVAIAPRYRTARLNLGVALYYAGDMDRAARLLEDVRAGQPGELRASFVLGLLREYGAHYDRALPLFRAVADGDPADPDAWYHLGYCLGRVGRHDEAAAAFRRAAVLSPYQRRIRYGLFLALTRAGHAREAQQELEAFRALSDARIRAVDGPKNTLEYLQQGRHAEARADSRGEARPGPAPVYVDVTAASGIAASPTRAAAVDGLAAVLRGEPRPAAFFAVERTRAALAAVMSVSAAVVDADNDGRLDLYALAGGRHTLYLQRAAGHFQAQTGLPSATTAVAAAWGDIDNDGWSDLVLAEPGRVVVAHNDHGRVGRPRTAATLSPGYRAGGIALADIDHDGDLDIALGGGVALARPRAAGPLRFPQDFAARPNVVLRNNSNGTFRDIAGEAGLAAGRAPTFRVWFGDVDDDRAIDAVLVGAGGTQEIHLNGKDGRFHEARERRVPPPAPSRLDEARAYGDVDRDGAVDELVAGPRGIRLRRNTTRPTHWLTVGVLGYAVPGKVKSNRLGIGTKIEVRSPGFWERREVRAGNGLGGTDAAEATFDLGEQARLDFVRAIFPSGVRKTETDTPADRRITLDEPLLDVNSCPTLFTWNGSRFEFVTDTLSAGILGELIAPGRYWQPDADEWVRIEGRQLVGNAAAALAIRFTNPLEEVTYLDSARLLAVDHPRGTEVYTDERMTGVADPARVVRLLAVRDGRPVAAARDQHGHDVSPALAAADRRFFDHFAPRPFKGFAGEWSLELDLGALGGTGRPVLGLDGWSYWNSSAAVVAASQAGERLEGPVLEVRDRDGRWRLATDDFGVPAGLPRTMLVDLQPYLRPGEQVIRIRANRTVYYDRVWVGDAVDVRAIGQGGAARSMATTEAPLAAANLRWLGYPRRRLPDGQLPEVFDYDSREPSADWGTHAGLLTRFGDVRPLLEAIDDRLVIMGHGEEIALAFDGRGLPPLRQGWQRTFFFYGHGYEKGYELTTAHADTVEPLPYRGMPPFPLDPSAGRWDVEGMAYQLEWNTRPAFLGPPR